ncbi:unnamed protein product, partial [Ectocarpus sp. 12 AP-2014]
CPVFSHLLGDTESEAWKGSTTSTVSSSTNLIINNSRAIVANFVDSKGTQRFVSSPIRLDRSGSNMTVTYNFSPSIPANEIAFIINDVNNNTPTYTLVATGGAGTTDFDIVRSGNLPILKYDATLGTVEKSNSDLSIRESGVLIGTTTNLVSSLTISSINLTDFVAYGLFAMNTCNTDNDNTRGSLDLDSDNDGCPDALEGDGGFGLDDLDTNGRLTGGINPNTGIPLKAGTGQSDVSTTDAAITGGACD